MGEHPNGDNAKCVGKGTHFNQQIIKLLGKNNQFPFIVGSQLIWTKSMAWGWHWKELAQGKTNRASGSLPSSIHVIKTDRTNWLCWYMRRESILLSGLEGPEDLLFSDC